MGRKQAMITLPGGDEVPIWEWSSLTFTAPSGEFVLADIDSDLVGLVFVAAEVRRSLSGCASVVHPAAFRLTAQVAPHDGGWCRQVEVGQAMAQAYVAAESAPRMSCGTYGDSDIFVVFTCLGKRAVYVVQETVPE